LRLLQNAKRAVNAARHYTVWQTARLWHWGTRKRRWDAIYWISRVADEPEELAPGALYVVEDAGQAWAAILACPCGCGEPLHANLIPDSEPVWKLTEHPNGRATLTPSVWRLDGCRAHFILREGRIIWA
jgi:hypothetical protein